MSLLDDESDAGSRRKLFARMLECPEFLVELTRPDALSRPQLLKACRAFIELDKLLDVRLTRLGSGHGPSNGALGADAMLRVLDVLNEISTGPRLVLVLNQLTHHPDARIATKAVMLMARRVRNDQWVERHLDSADTRLRASIVEGLWGLQTVQARRTLWASLEDNDNRVVGNALVGLHMLGEATVGERVKAMLRDERASFRWTAAWVMGKMGNEEFVELLQGSFADPEDGVRQAARRALRAIRKAAIAREVAAGALASKAEEERERAWQAVLDAAAAEKALQSAEVAPIEDDAAGELEALPEFDIRLDGSFVASRAGTARPKRLPDRAV